ncbi:MAG: hypothetical protein CME70_15970 [Halobacteriovorax sp.]|nr:hypothetical protein [Halobacteriovorax sp.]
MPLKTLALCINYNSFMRALLFLIISPFLLSSDNYKMTEGRKVFVGPSFKLWCSLTDKGKVRIGSKQKLKSGNLIQFPKTNGTGHIPTIVGNDFNSSEQFKEFVANIKDNCKENLSSLPEYFDENIKSLLKNQIAIVSVRTYDDILWEYYSGREKKDMSKNSCEIRRAHNLKKSWVVTYPEVNKSCL